MEELAKLPPVALVALGITLAFILAIRHLGLQQGLNGSSTNGASGAQVAAVIVDPTALNRLSDEVSRLVNMVGNLIEVGERMARSEETMAIELDRIREEMRIQREIERRRT